MLKEYVELYQTAMIMNKLNTLKKEMNIVMSILFGIIVGILLVPTLIYLRGRNSGWDDSNIFGIFHVLCHLALHPDDFTKMQYPDGKKPFWYLTKDEFSDILKNRPED